MNLTIIRQILHYFRIVNYNHFVNPTHYEWNIYVQLICRLLTSRYYVFACYVFPPFSMKGYSCKVVGHLRSRTDPATLNA